MRQRLPEILARSGIHKTKAGSFKLSQLLSTELSYSRSGNSNLRGVRGIFSSYELGVKELC